MNHEYGELSQLQRLRSMGWQEAQDYAAHQWGRIPEPTGRGNARLDQVWISPELLGSLRHVSVNHDRWTDHATVELEFAVDASLRWVDMWYRPKPVQWPVSWDASVEWSRTLEPTAAYGTMWQQLELQASVQAAQQGTPWVRQQFGRGQTLTTKKVQVHTAPLKHGRDGPSFSSLPDRCPHLQVVSAMFDSFQGELRKFEVNLSRYRVTAARKKREQNLQYVFQDCRDEAPAQVDTLCSRVEEEVDVVCSEDNSLVFSDPVPFDDAKPLVINGIPRSVVAKSHDQVWLDDIQGIQAGDVCVQETVFASEVDIMDQFIRLWEPRWNKAKHLLPSQWDQVLAFARRVVKPVQWNFPPWTSDQVLATAKAKKSKAGIGPDGVSRDDIVKMPPQGLEAVKDLFVSVEDGDKWPTRWPQVSWPVWPRQPWQVNLSSIDRSQFTPLSTVSGPR